METMTYMNHLIRHQEITSGRATSWDQTGGNKDYWLLPPNQATVLAEIEGPGIINHIWMLNFCKKILGPATLPPDQEYWLTASTDTPAVLGVNWTADDPEFYRRVLLKITWDDQAGPSVLCPIGDFFGIFNSIPSAYESMPFNVCVNPENQLRPGGACGANCYFPMPFQKKARVEMVNESALPLGLYFHIDYELYKKPLPEDTVYFHALWNRSNPCPGWGPELPANCPEVNKLNHLTGEGNYVMLDVYGKGHYVGCNFGVVSYQGVCWCEGDDMFFIDEDENDPLPRFNGTGVEDYFNHGFGIQNDSHLYVGSLVNENMVHNMQAAYRFHIQDPIHFEKHLKISLEHGHANHLADDWCSTAYWYQTLPSAPVTVPPVEQRLPNLPIPPQQPIPQNIQHTPEQEKARADYQARSDTYMAEKARYTQMNWERTISASKGNIEAAAKLRRMTDKK